MFNSLIRLSRSSTADLWLKVLISTVLLCLIGPLIIRMEGEMPITLQTLGIILISVLFGWRVSFPAVVLYIVFGAAGLPVFSGHSSGLDQVFGRFGGFFFGFAISAVVTGYLADQALARKPFHHLALWFGGHFIILLLGAIWLYRLNPESWWTMIRLALPGAVIKSAFGFLFTQSLARVLLARQEKLRNTNGQAAP